MRKFSKVLLIGCISLLAFTSCLSNTKNINVTAEAKEVDENYIVAKHYAVENVKYLKKGLEDREDEFEVGNVKVVYMRLQDNDIDNYYTFVDLELPAIDYKHKIISVFEDNDDVAIYNDEVDWEEVYNEKHTGTMVQQASLSMVGLYLENPDLLDRTNGDEFKVYDFTKEEIISELE